MRPQISADTDTMGYWLNWRVLLCVVWVLSPMITAIIIIWKYERFDLQSTRREAQFEVQHSLCGDGAWKLCLRSVHPVWLLAYRFTAFCLLLATLVVKGVVRGYGMYNYYTQWTFTLETIYFAFGSMLSVYGCYQYHKKRSSGLNENHSEIDTEEAPYVPLPCGDSLNMSRKISNSPETKFVFPAANTWSYVFQVTFQMTVGAVMLTDCIYWLIIYPFLTIRDYRLNFRVPPFGISFFVLWTGAFVIFQWILHAFVSSGWPYPFLDLSSPNAPLWYLFMALLHIPCYGIFALIVDTKHRLFAKWFPLSYQC